MYVDDRPDLIVFLAAFRAFLLHGFLQSPRAPPLRVCPGVGCIRGDQGPAFLCSTLICEIFKVRELSAILAGRFDIFSFILRLQCESRLVCHNYTSSVTHVELHLCSSCTR